MVAKLFAKHIKLKEAIETIKKTRYERALVQCIFLCFESLSNSFGT